jgi:hypothetical protein
MVYCDLKGSPTLSAFVGIENDEHGIRIGWDATSCVTNIPVLIQLV